MRWLKMSKEDSGVLCFLLSLRMETNCFGEAELKARGTPLVMNLHGPDWWIRHREGMLVTGQCHELGRYDK